MTRRYTPFILRCVKRRHPSGAPFMNDAKLECKGRCARRACAAEHRAEIPQSGVDHYIEQLIENVFVTKVHVVFQAVKLREGAGGFAAAARLRTKQAVAEMIKTQSEQVAAQEAKGRQRKSRRPSSGGRSPPNRCPSAN